MGWKLDTYENCKAAVEYLWIQLEILELRLGLTDRSKGDKLEERYAGQPRKKNGQFTFGKARLSKAERLRVSSGILTDHPKLEADGCVYQYEYGNYYYKFAVKEPGTYVFYSKTKIK